MESKTSWSLIYLIMCSQLKPLMRLYLILMSQHFNYLKMKNYQIWSMEFIILVKKLNLTF